MEIEFDPAKDQTNILKHGVSLRLGIFILENRLGQDVDLRRDYGELRVNAFAIVEGRLHVYTYTIRNYVCRIISVGKASRQEQRRWFTSS